MKRIADTISWVLHPFVLPIYMLVLLLTCTAFARFPAHVKWYFTWVVALYALVIPCVSLLVLRRMGRIASFRIDLRNERWLPLLVGTVCYLLCALTLAKIPPAIFLRKFALAAACCELLCLLVSLRWKISLHLTAMGAATALLAVMNVIGIQSMLWPLAVVIGCAGVLASARLYLGCHNGAQLLAGYLGGFAVSILAVLFL